MKKIKEKGFLEFMYNIWNFTSLTQKYMYTEHLGPHL